MSDAQPEPSTDVKLKLYEAVSQNFSGLMETRFKLLGLLPGGTLAALAGMSGTGVPLVAKTLLCLLGGGITFALWMYDLRNGEFIIAMKEAGAQLESSLGMAGKGRFKDAGQTGWPVSHGFAMNLIYGACMLGWLIGFCAWLLKATAPTCA